MYGIIKDEGLWRMKDYKGLEWEKFSVWGHAWDYEGLWRIKDYEGWRIMKDEGLWRMKDYEGWRIIKD